MTAELHITVGIPGCGKSTWIEQCTRPLLSAMPEHFGEYDIHSTDAIREELTGSAASQDKNRDVFDVLYDRVGASLSAGRLVVVDATNLKPSYRTKLRDIAKHYDAPTVAHRFFISEDFDECQRRNLARDRVVPEDVMRRFHKTFVELCGPADMTKEGWNVWDVKSLDVKS